MNFIPKMKILLHVCCVVLLVGCSGGGDSSSDTTTDDSITLEILYPEDYHIQSSPDLEVTCAVDFDSQVHSGWGVKFQLDGGSDIIVSTPPYSATFTDISRTEHIVSAVVVDDQGQEVSGLNTQDDVIQVARGNYLVAFGDSITWGYGDDDPDDDVSTDGRNSGGGFAPILNDRLTGVAGVPHTVINAGVPGETSAYGAEEIQNLIDAHPEATGFLIQWGTNDGRDARDPGPGDGSFYDNMATIITAIDAAGMDVYIAKPPIVLGEDAEQGDYTDPENPPAGSRGDYVRQYIAVIDQLAEDFPGIIVTTPPDFYSLFTADYLAGKRYDYEYFDNLHPDGEGYRSMADLWFTVLP